MTVADRIKNRRESLGMTQLQLADKMGYKTKSSISKIESSGDKVTLKTVEKAAKALNVSPSYFMGWVSDPDAKTPVLNAAISMNKVDSPIIQDYLEEFKGYAHSKDEQKLLDGYRAANPDMRRAMLSIADAVLKGEEEENKEKSSTSQSRADIA